MTTGHLAGSQFKSNATSQERISIESYDATERAPSRESTESAALLAESSGSGRLSGESDDDTTVRAVERSDVSEDERDQVRVLVRRMKMQIWAGTLAGLAVATAIGATFIVIVRIHHLLCQPYGLEMPRYRLADKRGTDSQFYVKLVDLWASTEQLWEGAFSLLASVLILVMGIAFLRMDRARVKWRYKLSLAFERSHKRLMRARAIQAGETLDEEEEDEREGEGGKWALFLLPFVTVLREGLEAVLFVSGVSGLELPIMSVALD